MSRASLHRQAMTAVRLQLSSDGEGSLLKMHKPDSRRWGPPRQLSHFDRQRPTTDRFWGKRAREGGERESRKAALSCLILGYC